MIKYLIYILKYTKFKIPYKEYTLLFGNGQDEIGKSAKCLRKELHLISFTNAELQKSYIIYKLQLLKNFHLNNFKLDNISINELLKFLHKETFNRLTFQEAMDFHNYTVKMIPWNFSFFSRFIYANKNTWIQFKLPFNSPESAYQVKSENEILEKFKELFKNSYLEFHLNLINTKLNTLENKIIYEYDVLDQNNSNLGKVYFFEYSKIFQN